MSALVPITPPSETARRHPEGESPRGFAEQLDKLSSSYRRALAELGPADSARFIWPAYANQTIASVGASVAGLILDSGT